MNILVQCTFHVTIFYVPVHYYMIKFFKLNGKYKCHIGLIKMKIKFTQQPDVFCEANYTYTHLNVAYVGKDKFDMIAKHILVNINVYITYHAGTCVSSYTVHFQLPSQ